ncbi:MAG: linear amide C-N hydrolase [Treponema sp.]|nr:linear amide C-N hydrolase [Treponema sp.]
MNKKFTCASLSGLIISLAVLLSSCSFQSEMAALKSLTKVTDGVFYIEYEGNYKLDDYIAQGGGKTNEEMSAFIEKCLKTGTWDGIGAGKNISVKITTPDFGCSSIAAQNTDGGQIYGRNYDWNDCSIIIVHTKPSDGYESISTSCLEFLGLDRDWQPAYKFPNDMLALASIYVPLDGINEKGLYIADLMAGDDEETAQNTNKPNLTTTAAIRLILDKAADVDEAIELLKGIDMHSVIGAAHHFAIADSLGKSVVVEYVNNQMYITEGPVLTNHYTADSPKKDDGINPQRENSRERFAKLLAAGKEADWKMDTSAIFKTLESVSAKNYTTDDITAWSIAFEPEKRKASYCFRGDYNKVFVIEF